MHTKGERRETTIDLLLSGRLVIGPRLRRFVQDLFTSIKFNQLMLDKAFQLRTNGVCEDLIPCFLGLIQLARKVILVNGVGFC